MQLDGNMHRENERKMKRDKFCIENIAGNQNEILNEDLLNRK